MKNALILGITGQDGSYLAELLLEKGYEVHGFVRRSSVDNLVRIRHILDDITLHRGDLLDPGSIRDAIVQSEPDEIYNEADQDNVRWSWDSPSYSAQVTYGAVVSLFEAVFRYATMAKVFQPVSATMYGYGWPVREDYCLKPSSPYACAKTAVYHLCNLYRDEERLDVYTGIMFNHDSPRRSEDYLVHKICKAAIEKKPITLYDMEQVVDIGHAKEFVKAVHAMVQGKPTNTIISTGYAASISMLAYEAYEYVGAPVTMVNEVKSPIPNKRPLIGDPSKAYMELNWEAELYGSRLVADMIEEMAQ